MWAKKKRKKREREGESKGERQRTRVGEKGGRKRDCSVRSIFKQQNEFDWSENFSSNGKRNWI